MCRKKDSPIFPSTLIVGEPFMGKISVLLFVHVIGSTKRGLAKEKSQ